jgi:hypothetical protein
MRKSSLDLLEIVQPDECQYSIHTANEFYQDYRICWKCSVMFRTLAWFLRKIFKYLQSCIEVSWKQNLLEIGNLPEQDV